MTDSKVTNISDWGSPRGHKSDGEPPDMLEARVARLESDVDYIKRDISEMKVDVKDIRAHQRSDFRWVIGGFVALLGVLAKGFGWL